MPAEEEHLVHHRRIEAGICSFQEEGLEGIYTHLSILVHRADATCEDVRAECLGTVSRETIIV